jgi:hypothetical protein
LLVKEKAEAAPKGLPQLDQYTGGVRIAQVAQLVTLKKLALIKGWELVCAAEV